MPHLETYNIEKSPLFRCGKKKDIATLLGLKVPELKLLATDKNYREWSKKQAGKKDRIIEQPVFKLAQTLKRFHKIIQRVETPRYLLSGKKGIKPTDNAKIHQKNSYLINVDISDFFQSTRREFVYLCFRDQFKQKDDVASILADLVTYRGHIPTGTATSQIMAFWAYKPTFDRMNKLCALNGITMSLWVDDITFSSSNPFPKNWVSDIKKIAEEVSLTLKPSKTKRYGAKNFKVVTGSAISPQGDLLVKNQKRQEIIKIVKAKKIEDLSLKDSRTLFGKLVSQRQSEPEFFPNVYIRCKKHMRAMEKRKQIKAS